MPRLARETIMVRRYAAAPFVLQTDCSNLIKLIKETKPDRSCLGHLIQELRMRNLFIEARELTVIKKK